MGAYLSEPVIEKVSNNEENDLLSYGASSMQGWRVYQEDAHNSILEFNENQSLFAVYDGHGGHEVAAYTASNLPEFIKNSEAFKKGQFSQALVDAFLEFDSTLIEPKVLAVLKEIAGTKDQDGASGWEPISFSLSHLPPKDSDYDGEEVDHLCREATMPLEEVMAKYSDCPSKFQSPNLRPKNELGCGSSSAEVSFGSSEDGSSIPMCDLDESEEHADNSESEPQSSREGESVTPKQVNCLLVKESNSLQSSFSESISPIKCDSDFADKDKDSSYICNGLLPNNSNSESKSINLSEVKVNGGSIHQQINGKIKDEGGGVSCKDEEVLRKHVEETTKLPEDSPLLVTESDSLKLEEQENANGDLKTPSKCIMGKGIKGKGTSKGKSLISSALMYAMKTAQRHERKRAAAKKAEQIYKQIQDGKASCLAAEDDDDDDDEDEDDENFEEKESEMQEIDEECSDDNDEDDDDEEEEEEEEEEDETEDDDSQYHEFSMNMREEPGYDSGCTACVAFLHGSELYVANVGDSRCVVCRAGEAVEMSVDHKPEDEPEANRITKAGGRITSDGRVNGGLNLSRALGDHSYKQNKNQPPEEQMISPLPDIRSMPLMPEDSFMIIACDGIWNSMSSQQACDFVTERLKPETTLSSICEELFSHCLAPDVHGDGTGCDNMTCIIIRFKDNLLKGAKRAGGELNDSTEIKEKRPKLES